MDVAPIRILNLSNNYIGDEGAGYLAEVLKSKRTLIQLNLSGNQISDKGVQVLANVLSHPKSNLQILDLEKNSQITDSSVSYLIDMINQNQSLKTLRLNECSFTEDARTTLKNTAGSQRRFQLFI